MLTFDKILSSIEYHVIQSTEDYLYVQINSHRFIFYNESNVQCFSLEQFTCIGIVEFFEKIYPLENQSIISVLNHKNSNAVNLKFNQCNLPTVLGKAFKLINLNKLDDDLLANGNFSSFLDIIDFLVPSDRWKFSNQSNKYYLIPNKYSCIQYDSLSYDHFGNNINIKNGTNIISYLSPFTLKEHLSFNLIKNDDSISIGLIEKGQLIIRSTFQELMNSIMVSVKTIGGFTNSANNQMNVFIPLEFGKCFEYQSEISHIIKASENEFESKTGLKYSKNNLFIVCPNPKWIINNGPSTLIKFDLTINLMQIFIEALLNPLNKELFINNISYNQPDVIDTELVPSEQYDIDQNQFDTKLFE